jgi:two-component system, NtrC family, response regulator HydG
MIVQSAAIRQVVDLIESAAPSDASVLLAGESGTGKEEAAREIHRLSSRTGRFLPINCAAISESLIESQLFGHERGAFTGADHKLEGFFERADGGTLFLDEITEIRMGLQAKLLRVLEEGQATRLGATTPIAFDVRVVAASNRSLRAAISEGTMRADLYYRLGTFEIELPPLRKRMADIVPLANHFVAEHNRRKGANIDGIDEQCLAALKAYDWPGNVRELRNAIERAAIIRKKGLLSVRDLPAQVLRMPVEEEPFTFRVGMTLDEVGREVIKRTFLANDRNLARTAAMLEIARGTVYKALASCGLGPTNGKADTSGQRARSSRTSL